MFQEIHEQIQGKIQQFEHRLKNLKNRVGHGRGCYPGLRMRVVVFLNVVIDIGTDQKYSRGFGQSSGKHLAF